MSFEARHISQTIQCSPSDIAVFAGNPANLPQWAAGLSEGIRNEAGRWITDSPMGEVEVKFRPGVEFGILDHDVIFPDGTAMHNPLRVLHNDDVSEVVFTVYRRPNVSDDEFARDTEAVANDLERLRDVLEVNEASTGT
ncbi:SRPBCC family protein [Brevibacterium sp. ZH18]|uniref:SRPBCC family protein n=1 Tax=Brevibacterium sp. ZH18 TaxID=2927784 RepID=UPI001F605559|nr:SRPBCC family protein [Brevibacterium sp. ZH18]MCI4012452.1 SRPBCC family protein [Brevibacterium sp. ZH18]